MTEPSDFNGKVIGKFRANGGTVGGPFAGSDILLLHHTGARFAGYAGKAAACEIPLIVLDPVK